MLPYLFQIGGWPVPTHSFFVLLGVFVAIALFIHEARRRMMLDERMLGIVAGTLFCGAVGAKLSTLWVYLESAPEPTLLGVLIDGGKSILGGLAGAYLGTHLSKRLLGYYEHTGDLFAPAVALGMAVGRVGCLLTEQIGTPTLLPWGIMLNSELASRIPNCSYCTPGVRLHPSFAYEIIFHLCMFALIWWWLRPRIFVKGELFKIYLVAYAVFRFFVEFVRGNQVVWEGLTRSQIFLIPSIILLLLYFVRQLRRGVYQLPMPEIPYEQPATGD
ncbi:MAG: prolipoprotein diacylglyceryl transferase [Oscillochloris sp.]|nr:prolipoprotein diacylglyceryl transferase [Oscillochloris sp.]